MDKYKIIRIALILLTAFGLFEGARLSGAHMMNGEVCPKLGPLPACYVVTAGYFLMFVAALVTWLPRPRLVFYLGWVPVFLLVVLGVSLELIKGDTCPAGAYDIPKCYYALAIAILCWGLFLFYRKAPLI